MRGLPVGIDHRDVAGHLVGHEHLDAWLGRRRDVVAAVTAAGSAGSLLQAPVAARASASPIQA